MPAAHMLLDGSNIRAARSKIGLTQSALAKEAQISQPYLSLIESGSLPMPEDLAIRVWSALIAARVEFVNELIGWKQKAEKGGKLRA